MRVGRIASMFALSIAALLCPAVASRGHFHLLPDRSHLAGDAVHLRVPARHTLETYQLRRRDFRSRRRAGHPARGGFGSTIARLQSPLALHGVHRPGHHHGRGGRGVAGHPAARQRADRRIRLAPGSCWAAMHWKSPVPGTRVSVSGSDCMRPSGSSSTGDSGDS